MKEIDLPNIDLSETIDQSMSYTSFRELIKEVTGSDIKEIYSGDYNE